MAPAAAEVRVDGAVPFSSEELRAALATRGLVLLDVQVLRSLPTGVEVRTPAGQQRIELGEASGVAAARIVALNLAEPLPGLSMSLAEEGPRSAMRSAALSGRGAGRGARIGFATGVGRGVERDDLSLLTLRADLMWMEGWLRWGCGVAWLRGIAPAGGMQGGLGADLKVVRLAIGAGTGRVEGTFGPAVVLYEVDEAHPAVSVGLGGSLRVRLFTLESLRASAGIDLDAFRHRVVARLDGEAFSSTPRVAVQGLLGLEWESAR